MLALARWDIGQHVRRIKTKLKMRCWAMILRETKRLRYRAKIAGLANSANSGAQGQDLAAQCSTGLYWPRWSWEPGFSTGSATR